MSIKIGNYKITKDRYQFVLSEKLTVQTGKNKGAEYYGNFSFYSNLNTLINALIQLRLRRSNATTLEELQTNLKEIKKDVYSYFN